ncbi:CerR family C-terminal domain-containing protein [Sphingomonas sp. PvP056]|uniref:CerR family C-terminal domain-containing protein n=1 Tax=Sphingomonas sp. PvP056 TaxID=3156392 RepID=UPI003392B870
MLQQRLLDIAIAEFGAKGLEGASTRGIAKAAGTAMSSITYHYGGKEGLYLAAADHIAAQIGAHMAPALELGALSPGMTASAARTAIQHILARFIETMGTKNSAFSLFIVREQMEPTEAFDRIYGGLMGKLLETIVELVRIATGRNDPFACEVAVLTLMGQIVMLRASRATALKLLRRPSLDADALTALAARIAANTDAILDRMIAERQELP